MKSLTSLIADEVSPLSSGEVLHADIEKMSLTERIQSYEIIQFLEKKLEERKKALNLRLKEDMKQVGKTTEKGHLAFNLNGTDIVVERRETKLPKEPDLRAFMETHKIKEEEIFDTVTIIQFNPSRVESLINLGRMKRADYDALRKPTYALTVEASSADLQMLEKVSEAYAAAKAEVTGTPALPAKGES